MMFRAATALVAVFLFAPTTGAKPFLSPGQLKSIRSLIGSTMETEHAPARHSLLALTTISCGAKASGTPMSKIA
jgi:hypothetical protein